MYLRRSAPREYHRRLQSDGAWWRHIEMKCGSRRIDRANRDGVAHELRFFETTTNERVDMAKAKKAKKAPAKKKAAKKK
jgi:hypothetical protein